MADTTRLPLTRCRTWRRAAAWLPAAAAVAAMMALRPTAAAFDTTSANPGSAFDTRTVVAATGVTAVFTCGPLPASQFTTVTWVASLDPDVTGYEVLRSDDGGPYSVIATVGPATLSYVDAADDATPLTLGSTYDYVVRTTTSTAWYADTSPVSVTLPGSCI